MFLLILAISKDFQKSWDVTANKRYSFSQQTIDFMEKLDEPVKFYAFLDPRGSSSLIEDLLDRYQKLAPRFFSYEIVDLQKKPTLAETLQVRSSGQGVIERVENPAPSNPPRRERVLRFDEANITNAISKLLRPQQRKAYFLIGHGERRTDQKESSDLSSFRDSLRTEGYDAQNLDLIAQSGVPEDAALLILAGPSASLLEREQELLDQYLRTSGKLFFLADLNTPKSYATWLKTYGFQIENSVIIDEKSAAANAEPVTPIGREYSGIHPVTRNFQIITAFTLARPINVSQSERESLSGEPTVLIKTAESAYLVPLDEILTGESVAFSSEGKVPQSFSLAAAGQYSPSKTTESNPTSNPSPELDPPLSSTRILVTSSTDLVSNSYFNLEGNRDFALNAVNWLAESEEQITVRAKDPKIQPFTLSRQAENWLYFIFCLLIPFLACMTGILITHQRRKGGRL